MKKLIFLFLFIILFWFMIQFIFYFNQDNILYQPEKNIHIYEKELDHQSLNIKIKSTYDLDALFHFKNRKFKTILFFHGNAGNLKNRVYKLNKLATLNINYLIVSYRGYNGNNGKPSEKGLYYDSLRSKQWLNDNNFLDKDIILYGESLGCAIAIEIGKNYNFRGIILESPFTSLKDIMKIKYPFLSEHILKDKFDNLEKIKHIHYPKLFLFGKYDTIIPPKLGIKLYDKATYPKYKFVINSNHMIKFIPILLNRIEYFIYEQT